MRENAFCMVFHVRWMFLTTSLRIPPSRLRRGCDPDKSLLHALFITLKYACVLCMYACLYDTTRIQTISSN